MFDDDRPLCFPFVTTCISGPRRVLLVFLNPCLLLNILLADKRLGSQNVCVCPGYGSRWVPASRHLPVDTDRIEVYLFGRLFFSSLLFARTWSLVASLASAFPFHVGGRRDISDISRRGCSLNRTEQLRFWHDHQSAIVRSHETSFMDAIMHEFAPFVISSHSRKCVIYS